MIILAIVVFVIELLYKPRLDITSNGDLLLWYGNKNNRKFTFLFNLKK